MTLATAVSQAAMTAYVEGSGKPLGRVERRASFAMYAAGLLSDLEHKSAEPVAALAFNGSLSNAAPCTTIGCSCLPALGGHGGAGR